MNNKLSEEEICSFMKDMMSVCISREELMNPTKEFVVRVYARFLAEFGVENVAQPDIMATQGMDNIERYETNILLWNITKSVANIVENAGVPDMSFADVVQPKRVRTNRIISALCMLYYRLMDIESRFSQMQSKFIDLPNRRQAVDKRIRELKKMMDEKAMYLSSNKANTHGLAQELKSYAESYEKKRSEADQMAEESRQLKTLILKRREKVSELDIELSQIKEEIHELEQKIVKSPDRIQADTTDKESELEAKRIEKKKLEKQYMELIRTVDFLKEGLTALTPSLESFTAAFKDVEELKTQCEVLCKTKVNVTKKEEQIKTLKVQIKEQEKTIQTLKTQIVNNEKESYQRIQTMRQINNGMERDLKLKTESKSEEERNLMLETQRLRQRLNDLEDEYKTFKEKFILISKQSSQRIKEVQSLINTRMSEVQALKQKQNKKFAKN